MKILILGGTAEARLLAKSLVALGHQVTTSLAGRTQDPALPEGEVRIGHFGGVAGLVAYLQSEGVERLVDATHPYAAQMSRNTVAAARESGVPLVRYLRPEWTPEVGEHWIRASSHQEAAAYLPPGANVLLTTGHAGLETYFARNDCQFWARVIETPDLAIPPHAALLPGRPPYGLDVERDILRRHAITHLISKNSGGGQTAAKLIAAREHGVQVIMIARPDYEPAREVDSIEAVIAALDSGAA